MTASGFLLAEDAALKDRLSGITVSDDRNANRPVKVFFRYPEGETEKEYPFITIEMVGLSVAKNRLHSEHTRYFSGPSAGYPLGIDHPNYIGYMPSELDRNGMTALLDNPNNYLRMEAPLPVDLMYQISTYTRSALHDRQLSAKLFRYVLPFRSNYLKIAADGTVRRLDLMGWSQADLLDGEAGYRKRIFRKVFTVMVNAEIPREDLVLIKQSTSVVGTINQAQGLPAAFNPPFSEEF